jgi:hypothetical protein
MDILHDGRLPPEDERLTDQIQRARVSNQESMRRYQEDLDRMMAATLSPWLAVMIGCIIGAGAFAAGAIVAKLL